jgi:predicted NodU family carbamoyl transferase
MSRTSIIFTMLIITETLLGFIAIDLEMNELNFFGNILPIWAFYAMPKVRLVGHHMAHAASDFYTSGFDESMIITADLTGEGKSTTLCYGSDDKISVLKEFRVPNSLGIFYSMVTQFLGFQRDSDEYKVLLLMRL